MSKLRLAESFVSINGEGTHAGELAVFLRFCGCNLNCAFCDTKWANQEDTPYTEKTVEELVQLVQETRIQCVTLTGGEPLLQPGIDALIGALAALGYRVEIETNGSIPIKPFTDLAFRPRITMDYKLPGSGMESQMRIENFYCLHKEDAVKFVVGSQEDMARAYQIIRENALTARCTVFFSPVFGAIEPAEIVEFLKAHQLNGVRLQLQLHKYIWDPTQRGV